MSLSPSIEVLTKIADRHRKSQIAIHYAHQVRHASPETWVFWIHASSRARFEEGYQIIADVLRLPGRDDPTKNMLQLVHRWLCDEENGPWLVIVDNADEMDVFFPRRGADNPEDGRPLAAFLPKTGRGSILVTSRSKDVGERLTGFHNIYKVPVLQQSQAEQILQIGRAHV